MKFDSRKDLIGLEIKIIKGHISHKRGCYGSICQDYGNCALKECNGLFVKKDKKYENKQK